MRLIAARSAPFVGFYRASDSDRHSLISSFVAGIQSIAPGRRQECDMSDATLNQAGSAPAAGGGWLSSYWQIIIIGFALGLGARGVTHVLAPDYGYLPDHLDNMSWAAYAYKHGVYQIYDLPANYPLIIRGYNRNTQLIGDVLKFTPHACNYPPGSAYIFWLKGFLWHWFDSDYSEVTLPDEARPVMQKLGLDMHIRSLRANTHLARFVDGLPALLFDFLLAIGVARLLATVFPARNRLVDAAAFAITFVAPPVFLDSALWHQGDSCITCLLVWALHWLISGRYWLFGLIYGVALMIKPQAILIGPVILYALVASRCAVGGSWAKTLKLVSAGALSLAVALFIAAPFMYWDSQKPKNEDGAMRWFERSYRGTVLDAYPRTTLNAFNLWWLDLMRQGAPASGRDAQRMLDSKAPLLGISKDQWGRILLAAAVALAWLLVARGTSWRTDGYVALTFMTLFVAFALPTRVHERYIFYCIPFAVVLALQSWRWTPVLLSLLIIGTFEMLSHQLVRDVGEPVTRGLTTLMSSLTLLTLVYSYIVLLRKTPPPRSA